MILAGSTREAIASKSHEFRQLAYEVGLSFCGEDVLSISVGEACYPEDGTDAEQLLAAADKRMYRAKQERNRSLQDARPVLVQ
jgi:diguanylate cyclase (GGDEF)-like protein